MQRLWWLNLIRGIVALIVGMLILGWPTERILGTLIAIAPVIGTARIVSAAASIMKAFELAEALAESAE